MSGKNSNETIEEFGSNQEEHKGVTSLKNKGSSSLMLNHDRASFYRTLSSLLDAGVDFETSSQMISDEYKNRGKHEFATNVIDFFNAITTVRNNKDTDLAKSRKIIRKTAIKLFAEELLKMEELILLQGLAHSNDDAKLLASAADFLTESDSGIQPLLNRRK